MAAHVCQQAGFTESRWHALDALAEILLRFLREVGAAGQPAAEAAGRSSANASDLLDALTSLRIAPSSIARFMISDAAAPPNSTLASFPTLKRPKLNPSFAASSSSPPQHIPSFLPAFPDAQSLARSPSSRIPSHHRRSSQRHSASNLKATQSKLLSERRSAESSLLKLTEQLAQHNEHDSQLPNGSTPLHPFASPSDSTPRFRQSSIFADIASGLSSNQQQQQQQNEQSSEELQHERQNSAINADVDPATAAEDERKEREQAGRGAEVKQEEIEADLNEEEEGDASADGAEQPPPAQNISDGAERKRKRDDSNGAADDNIHHMPVGLSFGIVAKGRRAQVAARAARGGTPKAQQSPVPTPDMSFETVQTKERVESLIQQERQQQK